MLYLAIVLFVGDCVLAYYLWREKHAHHYTKAALRYWRET